MLFEKIINSLLSLTLLPIARFLLRLLGRTSNALAEKFFSGSIARRSDLTTSIEGLWNCHEEQIRELQLSGRSPMTILAKVIWRAPGFMITVVRLWFGQHSHTFRIGFTFLWVAWEDDSANSNRLMSLLDNYRAAFIRLDKNVQICYWGRNAEDLFLFDSNRALNQSAFSTFIPEQELAGRQLIPLIRELYRDPEMFRLHLNENIDSEGRRMFVLWFNQPSFYVQERLQGMQCYGVQVFSPRIGHAIVQLWCLKVRLSRFQRSWSDES
jgi:PAS domain-containing protein